MENNILQINKLNNDIIDTINNSELNVGVIYYVIKDIYTEIEKLYNQQIQIEMIKSQEQEIKEE